MAAATRTFKRTAIPHLNPEWTWTQDVFDLVTDESAFKSAAVYVSKKSGVRGDKVGRMAVIQRMIQSRLCRYGLLLLVCGSGPLVVVMLAAKFGLTSDPNPNPIGFGILAFLTFWPSLTMMGVGLWRAFRTDGSDVASR